MPARRALAFLPVKQACADTQLMRLDFVQRSSVTAVCVPPFAQRHEWPIGDVGRSSTAERASKGIEWLAACLNSTCGRM